MRDLSITRDEKARLAHVEGQTDEGVEFLDAYMPAQGVEFVVLDSGRIIIPLVEMDAFEKSAREQGVTISDWDGRPSTTRALLRESSE